MTGFWKQGLFTQQIPHSVLIPWPFWVVPSLGCRTWEAVTCRDLCAAAGHVRWARMQGRLPAASATILKKYKVKPTYSPN